MLELQSKILSELAEFSSENFNVITTTFAPFQVMRCCEQIKVNLGYMKNKIIMIGIASGLVLGNLGYTHCCVEDVGVLRSIPNLTIVSPADSLEVVKVLQAVLKSKIILFILGLLEEQITQWFTIKIMI